MTKEFVLGIDEIGKLISFLKKKAPKGGIFLLKGDLASGKTTLVKEFCKEAGIKESVSSPTFSVLNIYEDRVYHYDIYNKGLKEFLSMGLLETLEEEGYHFIEWADENLEEILKNYGYNYFKISITPIEDKRVYKVEYES